MSWHWLIPIGLGIGVYFILTYRDEDWPPSVWESYRWCQWYCWLIWVPTFLLSYVGPWQQPMSFMHSVANFPYLLLIAVWLYYWINWRLSVRRPLR